MLASLWSRGSRGGRYEALDETEDEDDEELLPGPRSCPEDPPPNGLKGLWMYVRRSLDVNIRNYCKIDLAFEDSLRKPKSQTRLQSVVEDLVRSKLVHFASVCIVGHPRGNFGLAAMYGPGSEYFPPVLQASDHHHQQQQHSKQKTFTLFTTRIFAIEGCNWTVEDVTQSCVPWFYDCNAAVPGMPKEVVWLKRVGMQSVLALPCMHHGRVFGVFTVGFRSKSWDQLLLSKLQELCHRITPFVVETWDALRPQLQRSRLRRFESSNDIAAAVIKEMINLDKMILSHISSRSSNVGVEDSKGSNVLIPPSQHGCVSAVTASVCNSYISVSNPNGAHESAGRLAAEHGSRGTTGTGGSSQSAPRRASSRYSTPEALSINDLLEDSKMLRSMSTLELSAAAAAAAAQPRSEEMVWGFGSPPPARRPRAAPAAAPAAAAASASGSNSHSPGTSSFCSAGAGGIWSPDAHAAVPGVSRHMPQATYSASGATMLDVEQLSCARQFGQPGPGAQPLVPVIGSNVWYNDSLTGNSTTYSSTIIPSSNVHASTDGYRHIDAVLTALEEDGDVPSGSLDDSMAILLRALDRPGSPSAPAAPAAASLPCWQQPNSDHSSPATGSGSSNQKYYTHSEAYVHRQQRQQPWSVSNEQCTAGVATALASRLYSSGQAGTVAPRASKRKSIGIEGFESQAFNN